MTEQRFKLLSYHFNDLQAEIKDNLTNETLHLSLYELVDLLNEVAQKEYDLKQLRDDFFSRFDRAIEVKGDVE